jgi:hypothetical protein
MNCTEHCIIDPQVQQVRLEQEKKETKHPVLRRITVTGDWRLESYIIIALMNLTNI